MLQFAKDCRQILKEYVWQYSLGKVFAIMVALLDTWGLVVLAHPSVNNVVSHNIHIDVRVWYGLVIISLFVICLLLLRGIREERKLRESRDHLRLVYNEELYSTCREMTASGELFRIGIRNLGIDTIRDPIIFPITLNKNGRALKPRPKQIPLTPMVRRNEVHTGFMIEYWVNLFTYKIGSRTIELCYDGVPSEPITLSKGQYSLVLLVRGTPNEEHRDILEIKVGQRGRLEFMFKRQA